MEQNNSNPTGSVLDGDADFGNVPNGAESFRKVPNASESFGKMRNDSEGFRSVPKATERKENHTLTVREVARMFETAGVARTERSITNWCQPNKLGVARLDAYFDPNERRYFITPQSAEQAITEERAKAVKSQVSEPVGSAPNGSEPEPLNSAERTESDLGDVAELKKQVRDLEITNRAKDMYIDRLESERHGYVEKLMEFNRKVGELETKLLLGAPRPESESNRPSANV